LPLFFKEGKRKGRNAPIDYAKILNSKGGFRETFGWKRTEVFEIGKDYEKLFEAC